MISYENVYWAYSSAAQTVAAFVALLIAGYAVVLNMMESAAKSDETLFEIHEELKANYHSGLAILSINTAAAIILCLCAVYFNKIDSWWTYCIEVSAAIFAISSIIGGVVFIIIIIDPKKYKKKARALSREITPISGVQGYSTAVFYSEFVEIERIIRHLWETRTELEKNRRHGTPIFREVLEIMSSEKVLPVTLYLRLLSAIRYRNLVFHGHPQMVDQRIIDQLRLIKEDLVRLTTA